MIRRLEERTRTLRIRLEAPLVVATLGGTGVGKSALVNALAGAELVETGRSRPTTRQPRMICRPDLAPQVLGISPEAVELVQRDLPSLSNLVIIDCPDPDTTEEPNAADTNLARLRQILPHCDVLLVATTQQKYRSARVAEELNLAATGAQLVLVQTHADTDEDIRDDWRRVLEERYTTGHIFFVDSLAALADAQQGLQPRGEFAGLVDLLTRQLAGAAATRIRRANFLDLMSETLDACEAHIREGLPSVRQVETAIGQQRAKLASQMAEQMRSELLGSRRQWETRLIGQIISRWGFSPFSMVLRIFQGLGGLLSSALLLRARTPAQVALWGAVQGTRTWQRRRQNRDADAAVTRAVTGWDASALRSAAVVVDGYAMEAGLPRESTDPEAVAAEAAAAGRSFVADVSAELESIIDRVALRHTGWWTRWRYELLLLAMTGILLVRLAKNFFYDSWLAASPAPLYGIEFYVLAVFWLVLWCVLLLWAFTRRLRRGLKVQINELAEGWNHPKSAADVFAGLELECRRIERFESDLGRIQQDVASLRRRLVSPEEQLGHRR
ncbi:MAG: GTPase domain-containing protein [Rhodopirellula sp.]|nr:GTPase domain-containing protein [Rhodopirellula sp.]